MLVTRFVNVALPGFLDEKQEFGYPEKAAMVNMVLVPIYELFQSGPGKEV